MGPQVFIRILSGEPYRKSTPAQIRWGTAIVAFLPVPFFLLLRYGIKYLDRASSLGAWLYTLGGLFAFFCFLFAWTKNVPVIVSWILGAVIWALMLWMSFTGKI
jgi:hypothetical protein